MPCGWVIVFPFAEAYASYRHPPDPPVCLHRSAFLARNLYFGNFMIPLGRVGVVRGVDRRTSLLRSAVRAGSANS